MQLLNGTISIVRLIRSKSSTGCSGLDLEDESPISGVERAYQRDSLHLEDSRSWVSIRMPTCLPLLNKRVVPGSFERKLRLRVLRMRRSLSSPSRRPFTGSTSREPCEKSIAF